MTKSSRIVLVAATAACVLAAAAAAFALTARPAGPAQAVSPAAAGGVAFPAEREGHAGRPLLSPGASPASTPDPGSSSGRSPSGAVCVTSAGNGNCGPYGYRPISNSNGYTTYVANNMWACGNGSCGPQTLTAYSPGTWYATSTQATGNTAVLTYPNTQQVFTKTTDTDPALSAFTSITSDFTETMSPQAGTDAEAAYDLWLSNTSGPKEVMIWVDNVGRGSGGAQRIGAATIAGQAFTVYQYQGGEVIFSLNQNEQSGTVDILAALKWLQGHGLASAGAQLGQVDFGFEICSTGGKPEKFAVSRYTLASTCGQAGGCFG